MYAKLILGKRNENFQCPTRVPLTDSFVKDNKEDFQCILI